jgi:hypothetical protein
MDEEFCDLRTVRLVRWQSDDYLNRADQPALCKRTENQPAALLDLAGHDFECGSRLLVRERRQIADRRAAGDAIGEDAREPVKLRVRLGHTKAANLDLVGRGHRGQALHQACEDP